MGAEANITCLTLEVDLDAKAPLMTVASFRAVNLPDTTFSFISVSSSLSEALQQYSGTQDSAHLQQLCNQHASAIATVAYRVSTASIYFINNVTNSQYCENKPWLLLP